MQESYPSIESKLHQKNVWRACPENKNRATSLTEFNKMKFVRVKDNRSKNTEAKIFKAFLFSIIPLQRA